ncbi:MAG: ribonucleotide reductase subunit alpha [Rubrivivax sp.]
MEISHFNDLLVAARGQSEPQRLLLVFASASLPAGATAEQRARFEAGESGELAPLMCVDKDPGALADFAALIDEAATLGAQWALMFAAALSGKGGHPPTDSQVDAALQRMVDAVKAGDLSGLIPFDRQGEAVQLG